MNNIYMDLDLIKEKYPNLVYKSENNTLEGNIEVNRKVNDEIIKGCYPVRIVFNKDFIPYVYDIGGKINKKYSHKYHDSRLCLATDIEQQIFINDKKSICKWIEKYVESYFISYEYYKRYGTYPFGQYSHGTQGILEFCCEYFELKNNDTNQKIIEYILLHTYRGHDLCPCGSNRRVRNCHKEIIIKCQCDNNYDIISNYFKKIKEVCKNETKFIR